MWVGNWLGMVVPVCNLRQAESRRERGSWEGGGLMGILCPKCKQDFSPPIPGNGKFRSLFSPKRRTRPSFCTCFCLVQV